MQQVSTFYSDWMSSFEALNEMPPESIPSAVRLRAERLRRAVDTGYADASTLINNMNSTPKEHFTAETWRAAEGVWIAFNGYQNGAGDLLAGHDSCCCSHAVGINEACRALVDPDIRLEMLKETEKWLVRTRGVNGERCAKGRAALFLAQTRDHQADILIEQAELKFDPDVSDFAIAHRGDWRQLLLAREISKLPASPLREIARFRLATRCIEQLQKRPRKLRPVGMIDEFLREAFAVADEGLKSENRVAWAQRLILLKPLVRDSTGRFRRDRLAFAYGDLLRQARDQGIVPTVEGLEHLASKGYLPAALHILNDAHSISDLAAEKVLDVIRLVYVHGTIPEKQTAAHALQNLFRRRAVEIPPDFRDESLDWLNQVQSRSFSRYAAKAHSDRHAMLALAHAFEFAQGAPAVGATIGTNVLDAMWKQALFWRLHVLDAPFGKSLQFFKKEPSDDLDRDALLGIAAQCRDGRGVPVAADLNDKFLELASMGETDTSRRAAFEWAVALSKQAKALPSASDKEEPIVEVAEDFESKILAQLKKAARSMPVEAAFEMGRLVAQPLVKKEATATNSLPQDDLRTAQRYLEGINGSASPDRFSSNAARALIARHFLGLLPRELLSPELIKNVCTAVARNRSRSALVVTAANPSSLNGAEKLHRLLLPSEYGASLSDTASAASDGSAHTLWSGMALKTFENLGGIYRQSAHLRFLQLHSELADLERRSDAPMWSTIVVRASIRANAGVITGPVSQPMPQKPKPAKTLRALFKKAPPTPPAEPVQNFRLTTAEEILDRSTRDVGPELNLLTASGTPIAGQYPEGIISPHIYREYRVDILASELRLSCQAYPILDAVLTADDLYVAAALALLEKKAPSFSLEDVPQFAKGFVDPEILQHLASKAWSPDWLGATAFGRTMYYADYLLFLSQHGRDLFSLKMPFVSAELEPQWSPPDAWVTSDRAGGLALTQSNRLTIIAKEITGIELKPAAGRTLNSFIVPHCNALIDGAGTEDTVSEKIRNVGAGDIRVHAARSAYVLTTRYPEMIQAFPVFGRAAYLSALYAGFRESAFDLSQAPQLQKRLRTVVESYQNMRSGQRESGDLDYVVLRGR